MIKEERQKMIKEKRSSIKRKEHRKRTNTTTTYGIALNWERKHISMTSSTILPVQKVILLTFNFSKIAFPTWLTIHRTHMITCVICMKILSIIVSIKCRWRMASPNMEKKPSWPFSRKFHSSTTRRCSMRLRPVTYTTTEEKRTPCPKSNQGEKKWCH